MSNDKNTQLINGVIFLVIGVLIAIFGGQAVLDIYFAIVALVGAIVLLSFAIYQMAKKTYLNVTFLIVGTILLAISIGLFTHYLSLGAIISFLVVAILGAGAGLLCLGIYLLAKKCTFDGLLNTIIGVCAIILAALYIGVADFRTAFWIVIGILIAIYGMLLIVLATTSIRNTKTISTTKTKKK